MLFCNPKYKIAGTADYLGLFKESLIIKDWKTNKDFKDNSDYTLVEPFAFLDKSDLTKYTLQAYL